MFDFLIDIVPREDPRWPSQTNSRVGYFFFVPCSLWSLIYRIMPMCRSVDIV